MDHKLKLMVVDDSPLFRTWLIRSLSEDDRFQVVGYAINAFDAQEKIPQLQPDMLTLDIEMPGMSGIDFLKQLLPVHPIPVILVSSLNLRVLMPWKQELWILYGNRMNPMDCLKRSFFLHSAPNLW